MQIVIHAGMQKTGSTAIQAYLNAERSVLAERNIAYPDFGHRSHHFLAKALSANPARFHRLAALPAEEDSPERAAAALASLRAILAAGETERLILSHEGFSVPAIARSLAATLRDHSATATKLSVVAYVRNPVEHYPSAVQNALRSGNVRLMPPSRWRSSHSARARELVAAFGEQTNLRLFSRSMLKGADVVTDFASVVEGIFGEQMPGPAPSTNNSSLSGAACCLLYIARAGERLPPKAHNLLRGQVAAADAALRRPRLAMPDVWAQEVGAVNGAAWNELVSMLNVGSDLRSAAAIPIEPEAKLVTSDQDLHDWIMSYFDPDLLDAVAEGVEAAQRPATSLVQAWLAKARRLGTDAFVPDRGIFAPVA